MLCSWQRVQRAYRCSVTTVIFTIITIWVYGHIHIWDNYVYFYVTGYTITSLYSVPQEVNIYTCSRTDLLLYAWTFNKPDVRKPHYWVNSVCKAWDECYPPVHFQVLTVIFFKTGYQKIDGFMHFLFFHACHMLMHNIVADLIIRTIINFLFSYQ